MRRLGKNVVRLLTPRIRFRRSEDKTLPSLLPKDGNSVALGGFIRLSNLQWESVLLQFLLVVLQGTEVNLVVHLKSPHRHQP